MSKKKREPRLRPKDFDLKLGALFAHGANTNLPNNAAELIAAIRKRNGILHGFDPSALSRAKSKQEGLNKPSWIAILEIYGLPADCPEFWLGSIGDFKRCLNLSGGSTELELLKSNFGQPFSDLFRMERIDARRDGVLVGHTIHVKPQPVALYERDGHVAKKLIGFFGIADTEIAIEPGDGVRLSIGLDEPYFEFGTGEAFSWVGDEETYLFRLVADEGKLLGAKRSDFEIGRPYTFNIAEMGQDGIITVSAFARGPFAFGSPPRAQPAAVSEDEEEAERRIRDLANKYIEREFYKNVSDKSGATELPLVTAADGNLADRLMLAEKRYGQKFDTSNE